MNTCGTCKYFGPLISGSLDDWSGEEDKPNSRFHECLLLKHLNGMEKRLGDIAGPIDGSGYRATFCVSEEFGCNQWELPPEAEREKGR